MDGSEGSEQDFVQMGDVLSALDAQENDVAADVAKNLLRRHMKTPPASIDMERAVIGGMMFDPTIVPDVRDEGLRADDFYRPSHGLVCEAIFALHDRGAPVTTLALVEELERRGQLKDVGGAVAVAGFEMLMTTAAHAAPYAKSLRELAQRRRAISMAEETMVLAYAGRVPSEAIANHLETQAINLRREIPRKSAFQDEESKARHEITRSPTKKKEEPAAKEGAFEMAMNVLDMELPKTEWLLKGLLTAKSVAAVGAEPKTFKTWAGLEMLLAVATGTRAFGEFQADKPRTVAAFLAEDDVASFRNRMLAMAAARDMPPEVALRRIHHSCLRTLDLRKSDHVAHLVASMRVLPEPPALLMLDPLRDLIGDADENDAAQMSTVMHMLRMVRDLTGATIMFVHHSVKANKESSSRRGGQNLRGSSAIHGALDCGIYLSKTQTNGQSHWQNHVAVEIKRARGAGVFGLELRVEDDEDGAAVRADWFFHRDPRDMPPLDGAAQPRGDAGRRDILELFRAEHAADLRAGREPRAWAAPAVAARLGIPERTARLHMQQLTDRGLLESQGRARVYRPQGDDDSDQ